MILQPGQRVHVWRRNEIGPRGDELAELDEGRAQLFQVRGKFFRLRRNNRCAAIGQRIVDEWRILDQVAASILGEQPHHVLVKLQVFRFQRKIHLGTKSRLRQ